MAQDPPAPRDESALCLACGLCCAGAFYDLVPLDPDELDHAAKLRLPLFDREPLLSFRLPCPRLDGTACTVYAERPRECARFACELLKAYRHGEVELDEAVARVGEARAAFAKVGALRTGDPHDPALAAAKKELSTVRRRWFDP
jgi:Fe-S-cluster containining protein